MTPENPRESEKLSTQPNPHRGRNRFFAAAGFVATVTIVLSFIDHPRFNISRPEIPADKLAQTCAYPDYDSIGSLNPQISKDQERAILDKVYDLEGGKKTFGDNPTAAGMSLYEKVSPKISPDKSLIAYSSFEGNVKLMGPDGSAVQNLTPPSLQWDIRNTLWFPDGKRILYQGYDQVDKTYSLFSVNLLGFTKKINTEPKHVRDYVYGFMQNGSIVYNSHDGHLWDEDNKGYTQYDDVYTIMPDGSKKTKITIDSSPMHIIDSPISISPDGKMFVFSARSYGMHFKEAPAVDEDGNPVENTSDSKIFMGDSAHTDDEAKLYVYHQGERSAQNIGVSSDWEFKWSDDNKLIRFYKPTVDSYLGRLNPDPFVTTVDGKAVSPCPTPSKNLDDAPKIEVSFLGQVIKKKDS